MSTYEPVAIQEVSYGSVDEMASATLDATQVLTECHPHGFTAVMFTNTNYALVLQCAPNLAGIFYIPTIVTGEVFEWDQSVGAVLVANHLERAEKIKRIQKAVLRCREAGGYYSSRPGFRVYG